MSLQELKERALQNEEVKREYDTLDEGIVMTAKLFKSDKDRIKQAIMEEAVNFCEMIDCVDEPPALDYSVNKYGVKIKISAEIE